MDDINKLFHELANAGKLTGNKPVSNMDIMIERLKVIKVKIRNKNSISNQRDQLIKELAKHFGLDQDKRFLDFMDGC